MPVLATLTGTSVLQCCQITTALAMQPHQMPGGDSEEIWRMVIRTYSRDVAKHGPISGVVRGRESVISVCQHYSDVSHESSRTCQCIKDSLLRQ